MNMSIDLFVPGRLCLFGEHSDWAGKYRTVNSDIVPGVAIVSGIEQGIYARAEKDEHFRVTSEVPEISENWGEFVCVMDSEELRRVAGSGSFFCYCAGVASYMFEWYNVRGIHIHVTKMDMPMKSGLSSSAAICVLVCRAFNLLYKLNLSTMGEMNIAYWGELRTSSRCGRLDQACAFGVCPVKMTFDAEDVAVQNISISHSLYWVFARLNSEKNTVKILSDLNRAYPFAESEAEKAEHLALGRINKDITERAKQYIEEGNAVALGQLMDEAQMVFDKMVAPMCPSELSAPVLHRVLYDPQVKKLSYGGKGVGSQGDGSVQFIAKSENDQIALVNYLNSLGLTAYSLTLKSKSSIRKAIIPVAGFGTRLYPETKFLKKDFFPVIDSDGLVKPVILVLVEECLAAGIDDICIVLGGEAERDQYRRFFEIELSEEHLSKLSEDKRLYEKHILDVGKHLRYVYQTERKGFGDAVAKCAGFAQNEPVLLLLGDTIYRSDIGKCCALQLIEAYQRYNKSIISINEVPLMKVSRYGIISGVWTDSKENVLNISGIYEKPTVSYAEEHLGVLSRNGEKHYFNVFGQYILTPEVFSQLEENISEGRVSARGEIELTDALEQVRLRIGMVAIRPEGRMYDIGVPEEFRNTIASI